MAYREGFYAIKGYLVQESDSVTPSAEDFLDIIYNMYMPGEVVRINKRSDRKREVLNK